MRTLKFIVLLLIVSTKLLSQTNSDLDSRIIFKSIFKDKRQVFLLPSVDSYYVSQLKQHLLVSSFRRTITYSETSKTISDTLFLSKTETLYIDSCLKALLFFKWTDLEKDKYGLINFSLIKSDSQKKYPDFDYVVYTIAKPIFIRKGTICFLFYDYACGSLCGHGEAIILRKQNDNWIVWRTIYQSDS